MHFRVFGPAVLWLMLVVAGLVGYDEVGRHTGKTLQFDGSVSDDCPGFYVGVPSLGSAGGGFRWASDELLN
jgi:hypothetical protein